MTPKPSQTNELKVIGRFESTYCHEGHTLVSICHRILQQSKMCSRILPLGPWNWLPGPTSNITRVRRLHSIQLHRRDHCRVTTVLYMVGWKMSKMAKVVILAPTPTPLSVLKQNLGKPITWGSSTFSLREVQINKTCFFLLPSVIIQAQTGIIFQYEYIWFRNLEEMA